MTWRKRHPSRNEHTPRANALHEATLVDAVLDAYVDWREESSAVTRAYRRWRDASAGERALAFAAYVAALDREQRAGDVYADMIGLATAGL